MSSNDDVLVKCRICGRETDIADAHCPSCGTRLIKKLNSIKLTQGDYNTLRSTPDYWKCAHCDAITPDTDKVCHHCMAPRKEAPRKTELSESSSWPSMPSESSKKSSVLKDMNVALGNAFIAGVSLFKKLPKNYQMVVFGVLLVALGWAVPWEAFGMDTIGYVFILGGIILVLTCSGLLKPLKKKAEGAASS